MFKQTKIWVILALSIEIVLLFALYYEINNASILNIFKRNKTENNKKISEILSTFKFTQQEPALTSFIDFKLPPGWKIDKNNSHKKIVLKSPDHKPGLAFGPDNGAEIRVRRKIKPPDMNIKETLISNLPLPSTNEEQNIKTLKIDDLPAVNTFIWYEGVYEIYYVQQDKYYCSITLTGDIEYKKTKEKNRQELISKYGRDFYIFLNSVKFK